MKLGHFDVNESLADLCRDEGTDPVMGIAPMRNSRRDALIRHSDLAPPYDARRVEQRYDCGRMFGGSVPETIDGGGQRPSRVGLLNMQIDPCQFA